MVRQVRAGRGAELVGSLPAITTALLRRKVTITGALKPHKIPSADLTAVKRIYDIVEGRDERVELNLYITGTDEDNAENVARADGGRRGEPRRGRDELT